MRFQAHKDLCSALGLAPNTPVQVVSELVAQRCGLDPDRVGAALGTTTVSDDNELVAVANEIDLIRREAKK